jgi:hypothetical protein
VYDAAVYASSLVGVYDFPFGSPPEAYRSIPFVTDLMSRWQAANDPPSLKYFVRVLETVYPDALQLEHPFMWPLAERLLRSAANAIFP